VTAWARLGSSAEREVIVKTGLRFVSEFVSRHNWDEDETRMAAALPRVPTSFPFPREPYAVQREFMAELYRIIEQGRIGILESPTGTVSWRECLLSLLSH
jgi:hypothetical protein